jgi:hypothetical protein
LSLDLNSNSRNVGCPVVATTRDYSSSLLVTMLVTSVQVACQERKLIKIHRSHKRVFSGIRCLVVQVQTLEMAIMSQAEAVVCEFPSVLACKGGCCGIMWYSLLHGFCVCMDVFMRSTVTFRLHLGHRVPPTGYSKPCGLHEYTTCIVHDIIISAGCHVNNAKVLENMAGHVYRSIWLPWIAVSSSHYESEQNLILGLLCSC